jgi:hypothetical protein
MAVGASNWGVEFEDPTKHRYLVVYMMATCFRSTGVALCYLKHTDGYSPRSMIRRVHVMPAIYLCTCYLSRICQPPTMIPTLHSQILVPYLCFKVQYEGMPSPPRLFSSRTMPCMPSQALSKRTPVSSTTQSQLLRTLHNALQLKGHPFGLIIAMLRNSG